MESPIPTEIASIIAQIPEWSNARSVEVAPLRDVISLNNANYRVVVDRRAFVLRLGGETAHWLGVSRVEEGAAAWAAASVGVSPPILYFDDVGNSVMPFIEGRQWEPEDFHNPANMTRVVETLRRLHSVKNVPADGSAFHRIERLIQSATTLGATIPTDLDRHLAALGEIQGRRERDTRFGPGLSHNDFWANNFLDDGQRLWLVDWEFSGNGDGMFDLATLSLTGRYSEEQTVELLRQYGYTERGDYTQLHDMIYVVWFFEAMWSLVQHGLRGSGDYDYQAHTQRMFTRMETHLQASQH